MFEHLPAITRESLNVMIEKELSHFKEILRRCTEDTLELDKVVDCACQEFKNANPNLAKAVFACAYGVSETLKDDGVDQGITLQAGALTIPGVLALLRLIDRALESEELEQKLR